MASAQEVDPQGLLGRSRAHQELQEYESPEQYSELGDVRVVKDLMFTYHQAEASPMIIGEEIVVEKVARTGDVLYTDEIGKQRLKLGEDLGSFFTAEELRTMSAARQRQVWIHGQVPEAVSEHVGTGGSQLALNEGEADQGANPNEMGEAELAEYIREHRLGVNDTIALAGGDPDTARRVLEAENLVTDNDPRQGVVNGLTRVISDGRQQ